MLAASVSDSSDRRRIPLSPRTRKLVAVAVLVGGVWFVGRSMLPVAPRDVEVEVSMAAFRTPPDDGRAVSVEFARDGEPVRTLSERFGPGGPPRMWSRHVTLPVGSYAATVTVELTGRSAVRESEVRVEAGESILLPAPQPP
jgi:hypothetical protein